MAIGPHGIHDVFAYRYLFDKVQRSDGRTFVERNRRARLRRPNRGGTRILAFGKHDQRHARQQALLRVGRRLVSCPVPRSKDQLRRKWAVNQISERIKVVLSQVGANLDIHGCGECVA